MDNSYLLVLSILLVIAAIAIVALLANQEVKLHQLQQYEKELQVQLTCQKELDDYMERLRFLRHDARNYLLTMQALLGSGQYEKAKEFLSSVSTNFKLGSRGTFSDNYLVDELLSEKYEEAKKNGIPCSLHTEISHNARVDYAMLCCAISATLSEAFSRFKDADDTKTERGGGIDFYCTVSDEAKLDIRCTINMQGLSVPQSQRVFGRRKQEDKPQSIVLSNLAQSCNGWFEYTCENGQKNISLSFTLPKPPEPMQT
ncbi:hypothetical protein [Acetanaerobacterium elongatum]|uniref:Sensor_kinase_SpoOB-type, alpha-helical domain n=1 Tax=Acetanaerobacterium elongatum TaxID=258515 RepID=A0A1H0AJZ3_9FIRM|nr:hypothetical protein [Acetanaerobacterium elongatum]SDN33902.1 hypothetical protein SAMN05192585_11655 [Acetanaerobacterium elongatum]